MKNLVTLLLVVLLVNLVQAVPVEQVVNGSFESGSVPPQSTWGFWGSPGDNWSFGTDGTSDVLRATGGDGSPWYGVGAEDGQVFIALSNPDGDESWITQQLSGLVIGETYSVDFAVRMGPGEGSGPNLKIYIGNTLICDVEMARYAWYHPDLDFGGAMTYTANAADGSDPVLKIVHVNDDTASHKMCLDSVSVIGEEIPEPATLALLGLGGIFTAIKRRRS